MTQISYLKRIPKTQRIPETDQPVQRVCEAAAACNTTELLATIIGGKHQFEIAERLLEVFGNLQTLYKASVLEISSRVQGVGKVTAAQILAGLELGFRLTKDSGAERYHIHSPKDVAALVQYEMEMLDQEEMWVVLLNTRNAVLDIAKVYRGTVNASSVRAAEIFKPAIRINAPAVVLVHNHPSSAPRSA